MISHIAWLTPWNAQSAIATFSAGIVAELRERGHRVTIIRTESAEGLNLPPLQDEQEVVCLHNVEPRELLYGFDGVVANVGNHYPFHGALPAVMNTVPVFGIFHDGLLSHLAAEWAVREIGNENEAARLASLIYEEPDDPNFWLSLDEMSERRPMLEWLAPMCSGALIHSEHWAGRLRDSCAGEILVQPLAMPDDTMPPPPARTEGRLIVATIGHINPNKRAEQVLRAISSREELRSVCEYRLIGPISASERQQLEALAAQLGVQTPVFTGWLDDEEFRHALEAVSVVCCLRSPIFETGSASLITAMRSARPVLVSDHGVYNEIPEDLVYRCVPGNETDDIARNLIAIMNGPASAETRGQRARRYALETNSPSHYVDGLLPALENAVIAAPMVHSGRRLGRRLGGWGFDPCSQATKRLTGELVQMHAGRK